MTKAVKRDNRLSCILTTENNLSISLTSIQHRLCWDCPHTPTTFILQKISPVLIYVRGCVKLVIRIPRHITAGWNDMNSCRLDVTINLTAWISCYQTTSGQIGTYAESYIAGIWYRLLPGAEILDLQLANVLFDVILPSLLGSTLWSFG
jgi:hypothetical protein